MSSRLNPLALVLTFCQFLCFVFLDWLGGLGASSVMSTPITLPVSV